MDEDEEIKNNPNSQDNKSINMLNNQNQEEPEEKNDEDELKEKVVGAIKEDFNDTVDATFKGVDLAKNIAIENWIGVAQDAIGLLNNKKIRRMLLISILVPIISIILAWISMMLIFDAVGNTTKNFWNNVKEGIVGLFTPNLDGAIIVDDNMLNDLIGQIEALGVDLDSLKLMGDVDYTKPDIKEENNRALKEYIKKFFEAQAITQVINTKPDWYQKWLVNNQEGLYGNVYIYKAEDEDDTSKSKQLSYMPYKDMQKEIAEINSGKGTSGADKLVDKFSIDNKGNLVYLGIVSTKESGKLTQTYEIQEYSVDYMKLIGKYTTPMEFYLYLAMISQNPEFAAEVAEMAKKSKIDITIMYDTYTNTTEKTIEYVEHGKRNHNFGTVKNPKYEEEKKKPSNKKETTKVTTTTKIPKLAVTYVKSWYGEQSITYNKKESNNDNNNEYNMPDEEEPKIEEGEKWYLWKTDITENVNEKITETRYEEGTRSQVKDNTDEFIALLNKKFKIPNTDKEQAPGENVVSGAEMLFFLFEKDSELQDVEQWVRYALNKYTNSNNYGEINYKDLTSSFIVDTTSVGSDYIVDTSDSNSAPYITDTEKLKDAISKIYSGQIAKNLTDEAQNFIDMQSEYNVNAVFAMAVTIVETKAGTNWERLSSTDSYNWYLITGDYNGNSIKSAGTLPIDFRKYSNFKESTYDFGNMIANSKSYFTIGNNTVNKIASKRADEEWAQNVKAIMNEIYKAAGIDMQVGGFIVGGVTNNTQSNEIQKYIEDELIHTKPHMSNSTYQNGPFAKWWNNGLGKFQCTWWANGRASMYLEQYGTKYTKYPTTYGNGGDYYDINKTNGFFNYGKTPKPNSIISWKKGSAGHVAYVEGVTSDGIYISEAGYGDSWYGVRKIPLDGLYYDNTYKLNGYIYLDEPL